MSVKVTKDTAFLVSYRSIETGSRTWTVEELALETHQEPWELVETLAGMDYPQDYISDLIDSSPELREALEKRGEITDGWTRVARTRG